MTTNNASSAIRNVSSPFRITVIVPAFNEAGRISGALDSVEAQQRLPDEVIVVDDGSTDNTYSVVEQWRAESTLDVRLLSGPNRGMAAARNRGLQEARCDLVALLDADDRFLPAHLALLERGFIVDSETVLVFGNAEKWARGQGRIGRYFNVREHLDAVERRRLTPEHERLLGSAYVTLLTGSYIPVCGTLFRRDAAFRAGLYDESFRTAEDRDFWLRLSRIGPFVVTENEIAKVRYHEGNITRTTNSMSLQKDRVRVLLKMRRKAESLALSEREMECTSRALLGQADSLLYAASCESLIAYLRAVGFLLRNGIYKPAGSPRHFARAMVPGLPSS